MCSSTLSQLAHLHGFRQVFVRSTRSYPVVVPGRVCIWESSSGRCVHSLEGPGESVDWVAWHPRGDVILAGSEDFTAWMWNAQSGDMMQVSRSCMLLGWDWTSICLGVIQGLSEWTNAQWCIQLGALTCLHLWLSASISGSNGEPASKTVHAE